MYSHLRRELFHGILALLFEQDPELMKAFVHGRVIVGGDGVARRHYPRFMFWLADYPEK